MIDKGKALIVTVWFMSLISTNSNPKMWQIALIGILLYEAVLLIIKTHRKNERKRIYTKNLAAGQKDMERIAGVRFRWPMREVS